MKFPTAPAHLGDPIPLGTCLEALTTHELIRSISTVGEGVALLLDEDALATGAPELVGQTDSCEGERSHVQRSWRAAAVLAPTNTEPTARTLSQLGKTIGNSISAQQVPCSKVCSE